MYNGNTTQLQYNESNYDKQLSFTIILNRPSKANVATVLLAMKLSKTWSDAQRYKASFALVA